MAMRCVNGGRECNGCGACFADIPQFICPVCGQVAYESVFVDRDGDIIGCDRCAEIKEPSEML